MTVKNILYVVVDENWSKNCINKEKNKKEQNFWL